MIHNFLHNSVPGRDGAPEVQVCVETEDEEGHVPPTQHYWETANKQPQAEARWQQRDAK